MCPVEVLAGAAAVDEFIYLLNCTVEYTYTEAFAFHIEDEILAHDCQAYKPDVRFLCHYMFVT